MTSPYPLRLRLALPLALAATVGVPVTHALRATVLSRQPAPVGTGFVFSVIDVPGSTKTVARGLNNLGHIVGSYDDKSGHTHGFVLKNGVFATIDGPDSVWTIATGINNAGQIVGAYGTGTDGGNHGFVLTSGVLTALDVPDSVDTIANGVNNAGQIAGTFASPDGRRHGFRLKRGVYETIDVPKARSTFAEGINDAGQVVGRSENDTTSVGFLFADGSFSQVVPTPGLYSTARALNSQGDIVGQEGDPGAAFTGFIRSGGSYPVMNGPSPASAWNVQGINDLGLIVGELANGTGTHGYVGRPASNGDVLTPDDTRLPGVESPRALASPDATRDATTPVRTTAVTMSLVPGASSGTIRWITAIGSPATATFTARRVGNLSSGEVHVNNHDGVSFSGTVGCYYQSGPKAAWFSGTIDRFEGKNVAGNGQGTSTFIMSVQAADGARTSGRVTLVRGLKPFDCTNFRGGRQPLTAGAVIVALQ